MVNISQLPLKTNEVELKKLFEQFGVVEKIDVKTKQNSCFSFITFADENSKIKAENKKTIQFQGK